MKKNLLSSLLLVSLMAIFTVACTSPNNAIKDAQAGYTEYHDCLKACDAKMAQYTSEYNNCNKDCPAPVPTIAQINLCIHTNTGNAVAECIGNINAAARKACDQCEKDYIKHMQEVSDCKTDCLNDYNKRFEVKAE
jgi:hypothetical protein